MPRLYPGMPDTDRCSTTNVLPGSGFSPRTPYVQLGRYHIGELSLSGEPECLSLRAQYSRKGTNIQANAPPGVRFRFLHRARPPQPPRTPRAKKDPVGEWQNGHYNGHFSFQMASQKARNRVKTVLRALLPPEISFANRVKK